MDIAGFRTIDSRRAGDGFGLDADDVGHCNYTGEQMRAAFDDRKLTNALLIHLKQRLIEQLVRKNRVARVRDLTDGLCVSAAGHISPKTHFRNAADALRRT